MNFKRRGWLRKYIDFRLENPLPKALPSQGVRVLGEDPLHNDLEQAVYYFLQPTGLLYGSLADSPFPETRIPKSRYFDSLDRVYMVYLESLFACLVADRTFLLDNLVEEGETLRPVVAVALSYFLRDPRILLSEEELGADDFGFLRGRIKEVKRFEREINRRITRGAMFFYRPELFHNSFLFLDLYTCLLWQRKTLMEPDGGDGTLAELEAAQMGWREALVRLLICVSLADGFIEPIEQRVINHFLRSSGLPKEKRKELRQAMKADVPLGELELPEMPWIVRRYFLEVVLLTAMANREIGEEEQDFVMRLVEKLDLWEEEMHQSQAALELFLLENAGKLHFLKGKSHILSLKDRFLERATLAIRKNLDSVVNEIKETQELSVLLVKAARTPLTEEEKGKVREQLTDILKTIPALAIFALPGGGIILPLLIRLLPFNVLPSSFDD